MDNKNHEQYLEQIEIAIAETTKDLMKKHNGDLRAMANVCAEKQVEINRLKQYQLNDRKTIKQLRGHFQEAVDEATELKTENEKLKEYPQQGGWEKALDNIKAIKDVVIKENHKLGEEIAELKEERENASYELAGELEDINTRWAEDKEADRIVIDGLKEDIQTYKDTLDDHFHHYELLKQKNKAEIEFLKNQLDVGGMMNFSKYNDNDPN